MSKVGHYLVAFNHVHRIGQEALSDMGDIYALAVMADTLDWGSLTAEISALYCTDNGRPGGTGVWPF